MRDANLLDEVFSYHPLKGVDQSANYAAVRSAAKEFAKVVFDRCPPCADRTDAIRKIREAVMTANVSIALEGKV